MPVLFLMWMAALLLHLRSEKNIHLIISSVGYETKTIQDVEVSAGQVNELQILIG